ncbi:MAG: hypothetical protein LUD48_04645 [Prevotella sp.]|nr:hypothetical protein [Prevotella sp.]
MHILEIIAKGTYIIFSICAGCATYIYITVGIGGDTFIGICFFAITCIFAMLLYKVWQWICYVSSSPANSQPAHVHPVPFQKRISHGAVQHQENDIENSLTAECGVCTVQEEAKPEEKSASDRSIQNEIAIKNAKDKVSKDFVRFLPEEEMDTLLCIIDDYAHKRMPTNSIDLPLSQLNGMTIIDLYHFGWNIWFLLKPMRRRTTCHFLKKAFPSVLREISENTIYAKMTIDYGAFSIKLIEKEENRR